MSESNNADRKRRLLLGAGGAALALGATSAAQAAKAPGANSFSITRTRYGTSAEAHLQAGQTFGVPYILPFDSMLLTDGNSDTAINTTNNTVTIQNPGLYRVSLSVDWPGQQGVDTALRSYGIRRRKEGSPVIPGNGGLLIPIDDTDERLATQDITGSSAPTIVRLPVPGSGATIPWTPGAIPLGGRVSIDLTMPVTGIVGVGDVALAALTSLTDGLLGVAATTALILSAKVIAPDVVRVTLFNPTIASGVNVPQGNLNVVAMNAQNRVGESADGWTVLSSTMYQFFRGDVVYAYFLSLCPGDYMQSSDQLFLHFDKWIAG